LVVGVAIGFGGGVYWGQKNPDQAAKLSAAEEAKFLEAQLAITQKIQAKLDQLQNKTPDSKAPGNSFLGGGAAKGPTAAEVSDVKADTEKQEAELKQHLDKLKK
jgi:hypothetical protein